MDWEVGTIHPTPRAGDTADLRVPLLSYFLPSGAGNSIHLCGPLAGASVDKFNVALTSERRATEVEVLYPPTRGDPITTGWLLASTTTCQSWRSHGASHPDFGDVLLYCSTVLETAGQFGV
ncbi:hypothetical protein BaRGS_00025518 [Batillaria attramentaria]|uniref:Uncharacterized protein n=1 Tax=Batillaria attramentaria TaxID=370345 RepID=A0ABD0K816_9CAEN